MGPIKKKWDRSFGVKNKQEGAAVEGPPTIGPSLQLSTCVLFWSFLGLFLPAVEGIGLVLSLIHI